MSGEVEVLELETELGESGGRERPKSGEHKRREEPGSELKLSEVERPESEPKSGELGRREGSKRGESGEVEGPESEGRGAHEGVSGRGRCPPESELRAPLGSGRVRRSALHADPRSNARPTPRPTFPRSFRRQGCTLGRPPPST